MSSRCRTRSASPHSSSYRPCPTSATSGSNRRSPTAMEQKEKFSLSTQMEPALLMTEDSAAPSVSGDLALKSAVNAVAYSPNGQQLATGSNDNVVTVWYLKNKTRNALRFLGHRAPITSIAFAPVHGGLVASASIDKSIRLWTPTVRGDNIAIRGHQGTVRCVDFFPDGHQLISAGDDKVVKIWSVQSHRFVGCLTEHTNWVRAVSVSSDGRMGASGGDDRVIKLWDLTARNTQSIHTFYDPTDVVRCIAFGPDGFSLAAAGHDRSLKIWDTRMCRLLQHYNAHDDVVTSLSWHPSGNWMITSSLDSQVKVWDLRSGFLYYTLSGHKGNVQQAAFSADGHSFATAGSDGKVLLWDTNFDKSAEPSIAAPGRSRSPRGGIPLHDNIPAVPNGNNNKSKSASTSEGGEFSEPALRLPVVPLVPSNSNANEATGPREKPGTAAQVRPSAPEEMPDLSVSVEYCLSQIDILTQTVQLLERRATASETLVTELQDQNLKLERSLAENQRASAETIQSLSLQLNQYQDHLQMCSVVINGMQQQLKTLGVPGPSGIDRTPMLVPQPPLQGTPSVGGRTQPSPVTAPTSEEKRRLEQLLVEKQRQLEQLKQQQVQPTTSPVAAPSVSPAIFTTPPATSTASSRLSASRDLANQSLPSSAPTTSSSARASQPLQQQQRSQPQMTPGTSSGSRRVSGSASLTPTPMRPAAEVPINMVTSPATVDDSYVAQQASIIEHEPHAQPVPPQQGGQWDLVDATANPTDDQLAMSPYTSANSTGFYKNNHYAAVLNATTVHVSGVGDAKLPPLFSVPQHTRGVHPPLDPAQYPELLLKQPSAPQPSSSSPAQEQQEARQPSGSMQLYPTGPRTPNPPIVFGHRVTASYDSRPTYSSDMSLEPPPSIYYRPPPPTGPITQIPVAEWGEQKPGAWGVPFSLIKKQQKEQQQAGAHPKEPRDSTGPVLSTDEIAMGDHQSSDEQMYTMFEESGQASTSTIPEGSGSGI